MSTEKLFSHVMHNASGIKLDGNIKQDTLKPPRVESTPEMMFGGVHAWSELAADNGRPSITWAFPDHKVKLWLL